MKIEARLLSLKADDFEGTWDPSWDHGASQLSVRLKDRRPYGPDKVGDIPAGNFLGCTNEADIDRVAAAAKVAWREIHKNNALETKQNG